jgi:hypothetical protein
MGMGERLMEFAGTEIRASTGKPSTRARKELDPELLLLR